MFAPILLVSTPLFYILIYKIITVWWLRGELKRKRQSVANIDKTIRGIDNPHLKTDAKSKKDSEAAGGGCFIVILVIILIVVFWGYP